MNGRGGVDEVLIEWTNKCDLFRTSLVLVSDLHSHNIKVSRNGEETVVKVCPYACD